jgi:hypothetical protein
MTHCRHKQQNVGIAILTINRSATVLGGELSPIFGDGLIDQAAAVVG